MRVSACTVLLLTSISLSAGADVRHFRAALESPIPAGEDPRDIRISSVQEARQSIIDQSVTYLSTHPDLQPLGLPDDDLSACTSGFVDLSSPSSTTQVKTSGGRIRIELRCEIDLEVAARTIRNIAGFAPAMEAVQHLGARTYSLRNQVIRLSRELLNEKPGPGRDRLVLLRRETLGLAQVLPVLSQAWVALCGEPPQRYPLPGERESDPLRSRVWRPLVLPGSAMGRCLERAILLARRAVGMNSRSPDALTHLGLLLFQGDERDPAIDALQRAILLDPEDALAYDGLGKALLEKGDLPGAVQAWETAARLDPRDPRIQVSLAAARKRTGDLEGVVRAWTAVVDLEPQNSEAHGSLGQALMARGDLEGAADAYRQAIALQPENAGFHYGLGEVLYGRGDLEGAIDAYHSAISRDSSHLQALQNLGVALRAKGDLDGALAAYRQVIRNRPNHDQAYYNLGNVLMARGELAGAIAAYQKAIQLNPGDPSTYNNLGNALKAQRDLDGAIRAYRMAVQMDPASTAQYNLGLILREKGDREGAIESFRAFLRLCTDDLQRRQAEAIIKMLTGGP